MRSSGAPPELIAEYEAAQAEEGSDFEVDVEEAETVSMFLRLENTWRLDINIVGGFYHGCDIGLAFKLLQARRIPNFADIIDELLLMEAAAKAKLNEILQRQRDERQPRIQSKNHR
jgi:hypothetical protein